MRESRDLFAAAVITVRDLRILANECQECSGEMVIRLGIDARSEAGFPHKPRVFVQTNGSQALVLGEVRAVKVMDLS